MDVVVNEEEMDPMDGLDGCGVNCRKLSLREGISLLIAAASIRYRPAAIYDMEYRIVCSPGVWRYEQT